MATLTLDRQHTALLIADFYAAFMGTLPHAVDRQVVEHAALATGGARGGHFPVLLRHRVPTRICRDQ